MKAIFKRFEHSAKEPAIECSELTVQDAIKKTCMAIQDAYTGFDFATNQDMIDSYIYEIYGLQKRYQYLISLLPDGNTAVESSIP